MKKLFTKLSAMALTVMLSIGCLSSLSVSADEVTTMSRLNYIRAVVSEMGFTDDIGSDATDYARDTYGVITREAASVAINAQLSEEDVNFSADKYGIDPDNAVYVAAAIKTGVIEADTFAKNKNLLAKTSNYWAAVMLCNADKYLGGATKTVTETYESDELESAILYNQYGFVVDTVTDPTFDWHETGKKVPSRWKDEAHRDLLGKMIPQYEGRTATSKDSVNFFFIDVTYRTKVRTYTVDRFDPADIEYVREHRIADISELTSDAKKDAFAEAYIAGFVDGSFKEDYDQEAYCFPNAIPSAAELSEKVKALNDTSRRVQLSPDLQILRKDASTLPDAFRLYPYILESFPNAYYDSGFECANGKTMDDEILATCNDKALRFANTNEKSEEWGRDIVFPFEMEEFLNDDSGVSLNMRLKKLDDSFFEQTEEYYYTLLNTDYRTARTDEEWLRVVRKILDYDDEWLEIYLKNIENGELILKCDKVVADRSSAYFFDGQFRCKVYCHFMIESAKEFQLHSDSANMNTLPLNGAYSYTAGTIFEREGKTFTGTHYSSHSLLSMAGNPTKVLYPQGVWYDQICTSCGVALVENGSVQALGGTVRSDLTSEAHGRRFVMQLLDRMGLLF